MKAAIVRLAVLVIVMINQALVVMGWNPLPFSEDQIYEGVSSVATVGVAVWTWWKNAPITEEARLADRYMKQLKEAKHDKDNRHP